jgi:hypothetical protein
MIRCITHTHYQRFFPMRAGRPSSPTTTRLSEKSRISKSHYTRLDNRPHASYLRKDTGATLGSQDFSGDATLIEPPCIHDGEIRRCVELISHGKRSAEWAVEIRLFHLGCTVCPGTHAGRLREWIRMGRRWEVWRLNPGKLDCIFTPSLPGRG